MSGLRPDAVVCPVAGIFGLAGQAASDGSLLHRTAGLIGTLASGVFLLLLGLVNLFVLRNIVGIFRRMRREGHSEAELEDQLNHRGVMNRLLKKVTRTVSRPWQMFPVGLLFGLGFDTATEVSLLVLAGGAAALSLPWYAILVLPVLLAAGMSLFDSIDGCFMNFAYGWAFAHPVRQVYYNITITGLSIGTGAQQTNSALPMSNAATPLDDLPGVRGFLQHRSPSSLATSGCPREPPGNAKLVRVLTATVQGPKVWLPVPD